jgi:hypothetical protein
MSRNLLETIQPQHWESQKPASGSGFNRVRWLQGLNDLVNRPVSNRGVITLPPTIITLNGALQSTGQGINQLQPKRYAEFTVKARVTFQLNGAGAGYVHVMRTLGSIPANGAAPNAGDVIVGGDAFAGGQLTGGVNQAGAFSFLDTGLDITKSYRYYLAVKGTAAQQLSLANTSQLLVMERS